MLWLLIEGLAVALAFRFSFFPLREEVTFSIYQIRDLDRAAAIMKGLPIFFGPETSGGGHLPGPLYYYLSAVPPLHFGGWQGVWELLLAVTALAIAGLWIYVRIHCADRVVHKEARGLHRISSKIRQMDFKSLLCGALRANRSIGLQRSNCKDRTWLRPLG